MAVIRSLIGTKQGVTVSVEYFSGIPNIVTPPIISGTLSVPNILSVVIGDFTGISIIHSFQWKRNGVNISGAINSTYQLASADAGTNISVVWTISGSLGPPDSAESVAVAIAATADTTPPVVTSATISNISFDRFTVNTTTNEEATHYFIVILAGATAPTKAQIIAGINYGAVTVQHAGSQLGLSTNQNTTQGAAVGLSASTAYDVYRVAVDAALNESIISSNLNVTTTAVGTYVPLPSAPQLTNPSTHTFASGADLTSSAVPSKHAIISGPWNILNIKGLVGTESQPYIIVNENVNTEVGGVSPKNHAMRTNFSGSTHFELHGLSPSAPFKLKKSATGTIEPSSGLVIDAIAAGTHAKVSNFVVDGVGFAGAFMNTSGTLSGGTATNPPTSSVYYQDITVEFFRVFGLAAEGEAFYIGGTNPAAYAIHYNFTLRNSLGTDKGRDGLQLNGHANAIVRNCTFFNVGVLNAVQQRNLVQLQNGKFLVENCIFDGAPALCNLSGHDIIFRNCYFRWASAEAGYLGNYYSQYGTAARLVTTPVKVLFDKCIFAPDQVVPDVLRVDDPIIDVEFLNCIFTTNCSDLYFSNRGASPTGTLIGTLTTNGNTHIAPGTIPAVTYTNFIPSDFENHGKVTEPYYLEKGMGYRTRAGVVVPPVTPTVQASNLVASNVLDTSLTLTWTKSTDAIGTLILAKAGSAVDSLPVNNTAYTASSVFGSGSQLGTGNYVVYNAGGNSVNITGLTPSTTYHMRAAASNGSGATSLYLTTTATLNPISQATTATQSFNPFTDITWDTALNSATAQADLAGTPSIWTNQGVDGNALVANGTPSWDAVKGAVRFTRADNERFTIQAAGSYIAPIEFWFKVITPTAWATGSQAIAGLSNTHEIEFAANTGELVISGVATGFTPSLNTEYRIRIKFNGASSTWTVNNGTENTISLSTNSMGTPNWKLGSTNAGTAHFDGWMKYVFAHDQGLTAGEITDMWTWLAAN